MKKHYIIDMEMALLPLTKQKEETLFRLAKKNDVVILSNYDFSTIKSLLPFLSGWTSKFYILSQAGNFAKKGWKKLWTKRMNRVHKAVASQHIRVLKAIAEPAEDPKTIVRDLGGVLLYCLPGHEAILGIREAYDPSYKIRAKLLDQFPLESSTVRVRVSGPDSLVYTATGMDVEDNVRQLCEREGWEEKDCVYIISGRQLLRQI